VKRFYCTVCKGVKRVQQWPNKIQYTELAPKQRIGECNWHAVGRAKIAAQILSKQPKSSRIKLVKGTSMQQPSKKGGR